MVNLEQNVWGFTPEGEAVILYTLTNSAGAYVQLTNLGAAVISIVVPDREGKLADVALGYEDYRSYFNDGAAMGKTVGRYANRIGSGRFTLDGEEYVLPLTGPGATLHGGPDNFTGRLWESRVEDDKVIFSLVSPDGDQGFPGELGAEVVYSWDDDHNLGITFMAACNAPTVVNLTNHSYFNLDGHNRGSVLAHSLQLNADHYLATDRFQVPTGDVLHVYGNPMDFTSAKEIGKDIGEDFEPLHVGSGYDHCWVVNGYEDGDELLYVGKLSSPVSGRAMEIHSTQPGVQVYTGNFLQGGPVAKGGGRYANRDGVAIECQNFPDSPNHAAFPSSVLRPGETYCQRIIYKFTTGS